MCEHNQNTHGFEDASGQWVVCEDCGSRFNMAHPEKGWHQ